jgi:hypothetical protein
MASSRVRSRLPSMTNELPTQRVEVRFVGTPPLRRIERASGVSEVEIEGRTVRCLVAGSFQPFLEALLGHEVITMRASGAGETWPAPKEARA